MKLFLKVLLLVFLVASCSKDEIILSGESKLLSFSIQEISEEFTVSSENMVETTMNEEQELTNLTAAFTVSEKARVFVNGSIQTSGYSKNDFSDDLTYTVEAEDGSITIYRVIINLDAKIKTFRIIELPGIQFNFTDLNITGNAPAGTDLKNLTAAFMITEGSVLIVGGVEQVSEETKNDFDAPLIYKLTGVADDIKDYTVTITVAQKAKPLANAGIDKVVVLTKGSTIKVNLDGSKSSDAQGTISTYEWRIVGGAVIGNTAKVTTELGLGMHSIELTVTDSSGDMDTDMMSAEVRVQGIYTPIDANATQGTIDLFNNIANIANGSQFAFGQEFASTYRLNSISYDVTTSDCKDVVGDHPAVYGIDPHYLMYKTEAQKQNHIAEAKYAYNNGAVVTFDFHQQSKSDNEIYIAKITSETDKSLMYDIVNDLNGSRPWFYDELDEVLDIINNDLGFPIVFRLYHEMNGNWFWWGSAATNHSPALYVDFYKLTADYIKDRTNLVLFGWTPNQGVKQDYYPGDAYVDVVGIDVYEPTTSNLKASLIELSTFALEHGKVATLAETGYRNNYVANNPTFWSSNILEAIEEGGSDVRIGWALAWFNAPWHSDQSKLMIPNSDSSTRVKNDFIEFYNSPISLFMEDIDALNVYN